MQDTRFPPRTRGNVGKPKSKWFEQLYKLLFQPEEIPKRNLHSLAKDKDGWFNMTSRLCSNASMNIVNKKRQTASQVPALEYQETQELNVPALPDA